MKKVLIIVAIFFVWRLVLFLPLYFAQTTIPVQKNSVQYTLWAYTRPYPPVSSALLYPWANFDGVHYLIIAGDFGYHEASEGRFFPFYPILIGIVHFLTGGGPIYGTNQFFVAFFISNIAFLASLIMLYKLIRLDYSEKIAMTVLVLMLCFPTSFFFVSVYSESIFLLLTVSIFYFLRKDKLVLAPLLSTALLITRIVGVCILPVVVYELWRTKKSLFKKIMLTALLPLGLVAFAFLSKYLWGDWLFFIHAQQHVVNGRSANIVFFPQTIVRYIKIFASVPYSQLDWWISLLEFSSFFFCAGLLYYGWKKKISKSYLLFSLLSFLLPTQSGTFSGLPRYVMILFPLFLALALTKHMWVKVLYGVIGLISLFILLAFFSRGYFIA